MAVLHHLFFGPERGELWSQFVATLAAPDVVILLDDAARAAAWIATMQFTQDVQLFIPDAEMAFCGIQAWPDGITRIADLDWWLLIETMPVLLEWN